jgi:hypothetical protein
MPYPTDPANPLGALAQRAAAEPFFLGHSLADYQRRHGLSDADLCARLGCDAATLMQLRLCGCPGKTASRPEAEDVAHLAERYGINPGALAGILQSTPEVRCGQQ